MSFFTASHPDIYPKVFLLEIFELIKAYQVGDFVEHFGLNFPEIVSFFIPIFAQSSIHMISLIGFIYFRKCQNLLDCVTSLVVFFSQVKIICEKNRNIYPANYRIQKVLIQNFKHLLLFLFNRDSLFSPNFHLLGTIRPMSHNNTNIWPDMSPENLLKLSYTIKCALLTKFSRTVHYYRH